MATQIISQQYSNNYVSIPQAAHILGCNESTIRIKRNQYPNLFVKTQGQGGINYKIMVSDIPKLQITPIYQYIPELAIKIQNLYPQGTYSVKSLAKALGFDRKVVYSLIKEGLPVNKTDPHGTRIWNSINGQKAIDFLRVRVLYATVPEMERITEVPATYIRKLIILEQIPTRYFGVREHPYIAIENSDKIKETYNSKPKLTRQRVLEGIMTLFERYGYKIPNAPETISLRSSSYKRFNNWPTAVEAAKFFYRIKELSPQTPSLKVLNLLDISNKYNPKGQVKELIIEAVRKGGKVGANIIEVFQDAATFVKEPEKCLEALVEMPMTEFTLRSLVEYQAIHIGNQTILKDEWTPAPPGHFKSYMISTIPAYPYGKL